MMIRPKSGIKLIFFFVLLFLQSHILYAKPILVNLTTEQRINPMGIDNLNPAFSWNISSKEADVYQEGYQIQVFSKENGQKKLVWDSKRVLSNQQSFIVSPVKLVSNQLYSWKVKVWYKGKGSSGWSKEAIFHTSPDAALWGKSKWIAYDTLQNKRRVYPGHHQSPRGDAVENLKARAVVPIFKKKFHVKEGLASAYLFISGLGQYEASINGEKIGNTYLAPGWTNYQKTALFNSFDLSKSLKKDENIISAMVGPGFRYVNNERYHKLVIGDELPILKAILVLNYKNGDREEILTDESWLSRPSAFSFSSIYGGEDYDATHTAADLIPTLKQDDGWQASKILGSYHPKMKSEMDFPFNVMESFSAVSKKEIKPNTYLYDFGQNASAIIALKYKGSKGNKIKITPAEILDDKGMPTQSASGGPFYFEYTSSGDSNGETWQPKFTYYGFRYALVEFASSDYQDFELTSLHVRNSSPVVGQFESSSKHFNDVNKLILWGIQSNLASVTTDCPHREKLGWLEQTHLIGNSMQYNFNIYHLYNKIVDDMMDSQLENGLVPDIAPEYVVFDAGFRDSPEWGSASVIIPFYHYKWYGDKRVLEKAMPMMERYFDYLSKKSKGNILDHGLGDWFDIGPNPPGESQLTPKALTATATYYYDAKILYEASKVLKLDDKAEYYKQKMEEIGRAFQAKFYDPSTGSYATNSQTSLAMPLYIGVVPEQGREQVVKQLLKTVEKDKYALTAGDVGYRYLVRSLADNGLSDLLYNMNNRDDVPGYGFQIKNGATALTESWQAYKFVSNNHMMLGHLMEWLYQNMGGIQQSEASIGYQDIVIEPYINKAIDWVNSSYQSINGLVSSKWRKEGQDLLLTVSVPANATATIKLPVIEEEQLIGLSNHAKKPNLHHLTNANGRSALQLKSGEYSFRIKNFH